MLVGLAAVIAAVGFEDGFGFDDLVAFAAGAVTVLTFLTLLFGPSLRRLAAFLGWWETFRDQWDGIPAAPGRDRIPGLPERVNAIDGELRRNGGSTVKDAVFDTKRQVQRLEDSIEHGNKVRRAILKVSLHNLEAVREAFRRAGLEPPEFEGLPAIIEDEMPDGTDRPG